MIPIAFCRSGRPIMPYMLIGTAVLSLMAAIPNADGQTVPSGATAGQAAPLPPGTPLGGPGRRTLGGPGASRFEGRAEPIPPTPRPRSGPPNAFRAVADAIDRAADPS